MRLSRELFLATAIAGCFALTSCHSWRYYGDKDPKVPDFTPVKVHQYGTKRDYTDKTGDGYLRVTVRNDGYAEGATAVMVQWENGDWAEAVTEPIPVGETRSVLMPIVTPLPPGGLYYRITVNPGDVVRETEYGDNVAVGYYL